MFKKLTNEDLSQLDWAQGNRAALLRALHAGSSPRAPTAAPSGWGTDVTGNDPRSVRAYLAGKGDLRSIWWNLFSAVYVSTVPGATVERAMHAFHRFHHALTLSRLGFAHSVSRTAADIEKNGVLSATHSSVERELNR
jgi:hypothetical protein